MPAHYQVVEGLRLPARISGHPALDFCNTWAGWDGQGAVEYLADYEHLAVWAGFVGILRPDQVSVLRQRARGRAGAAASVLERARTFRANLYAVLATLLAPQPGLPSTTRSPRPLTLSACAEEMMQSAGRSHRRQTSPPHLPPRRGQPASSSPRLLPAASAYARGPVADGCSSTPPDGVAGASWPPVATAKKRDASLQSTKTPPNSPAMP